MSWYSDKETPSKWYLERTGDGNDEEYTSEYSQFRLQVETAWDNDDEEELKYLEYREPRWFEDIMEELKELE